MSRYQFIWWGWSNMLWQLYPSDFYGGLATVYKWWLCLGPLEIRRWKK
jgi:hypothetical protein